MADETLVPSIEPEQPHTPLQEAQAAEAATVSAPKPVRREDYQPLEYEGGHVHMVFKIVDETRVEVEAVVTMRRKEGLDSGEGVEMQPIVLNRGAELKDIQSLNVNGEEVSSAEFGVPDSEITLPGRDGAITMRIKTVLNPTENESGSGFYKSGEMLVSQLESMGFRNILPFIDRPDISFSWSTEITGDKEKYPNLLATGDLVSDVDNDDGTHTANYDSGVVMPDYIYAAVAGKFACLKDTMKLGDDEIELEIYAEPKNIGRTKIAMEALKRALKFDLETADRKYPLKTFKLVATLFFNFGAMENLGLNIFNAANILGDPSVTLDDIMLNIAVTVGHEAFHTFRGDIATLRTWHETALKEGFVTHTENAFKADIVGEDAAKIHTVRKLRNLQFAEDASATAHPILHEEYIDDPMNGNNYSSTTYLKGGQIFNMMEVLLGKEAYRAGANAYFEKYDGKAATLPQLIECFEDASAVDLTQFRDWMTQVGTPVCDVVSNYDEAGQTLSLTVKQECPKPPSHTLHFPMAMGLVGPDGQPVALELDGDAGAHYLNRGVLNITKPEETFVFKNVPKGTVPSLLRGFSAPVKLNYDYSAADLVHLMKNDTDGFNRYEASQRVAKGELKTLIDQREKGEALVVRESTLEAYGNILNGVAETNPMLASEMLVLPSLAEIIQDMNVYDFEAAKAVRDALKTAIATRFEDRLKELYAQYTDIAAAEEKRDGAPSLNVDAMKARKMKNVCIEFLGEIRTPENIGMVKNQFETATNMTDEYTALNLLAAIPGERDEALQRFYEKYKDEPLVINEWMRAIALIDDKDVVERVRALMASKDLEKPTPSRIKKLFGLGFSKNYTRFHAISGEGYVLAADAALNTVNEQAASTILKDAFADLPKMDEVRRGLMTAQLRRVLATDGVKKGLINRAKEILGEK